MTILVTGGAGYIGSHMVYALADAGEHVVVLDNLSTGFDWAVAKGVPLIVGESGDQVLVAEIIRDHGIEAIIHFAASIVVPDSVRDPLSYYRNNTVNSRALIECAIKNGVRHFIFSSTAAVYGNPAQIPVREDAPTQPISPYGWSKLMTEIMLRDASNAHGLSHVILRYFNVAGADPKGPNRTINERRHPLDQGRGRDRARVAAEAGCFRHRLSDTGRHLHPRLHSRQRSGAGALRCATPSAFRRAIADAQLRLRSRVLGARGDRSRQARVRR